MLCFQTVQDECSTPFEVTDRGFHVCLNFDHVTKVGMLFICLDNVQECVDLINQNSSHIRLIMARPQFMVKSWTSLLWKHSYY